MNSTACGLFWSAFLVLFAFTLHGVRLSSANGLTMESNVSSVMEMVPLGKEEMVLMLNESRRKLSSFQICALCTCCGGRSKSYCLSSPCCYAINCNIPNRPFGFCSFTPKTCNCFGCHL